MVLENIVDSAEGNEALVVAEEANAITQAEHDVPLYFHRLVDSKYIPSEVEMQKG